MNKGGMIIAAVINKELHKKLLDYKRSAGVSISFFAKQAIEEKIARMSTTPKSVRAKTKRSRKVKKVVSND